MIELRDRAYGDLWHYGLNSARRAWTDARKSMLLVARHAKQSLMIDIYPMRRGTFAMFLRDTIEMVNEEWKSPEE